MAMLTISQRSFGGPEVLEVTESPRPAPLPTEVLVRVHAAGVNPVEAMIRDGRYPLLGRPPFVLGWDVSGVVEEVGPGTARFRPGDEVYGMPFFPRPAAAYAEYVAAPSRQLARKPASLDHVHAAALPLVGLTAWQGLVDVARIGPGQRVLVHGGGGGVGHVAVQIARARGARVIATASAAKAAFVRGLGAEEVIDYGAVDFSEVVRDVDVVFDVVGGGYGDRSVRTLRPGGLLVTAVDHRDEELAERVHAAGRRFSGLAVEPDHVGLEELAKLVDAGQLVPHVSRTFRFEEAAAAHELVTAGSVQGKVVLTVVDCAPNVVAPRV
jgi:NADPH:quinone reductase-like Zn-dependent oxidoreductase